MSLRFVVPEIRLKKVSQTSLVSFAVFEWAKTRFWVLKAGFESFATRFSLLSSGRHRYLVDRLPHVCIVYQVLEPFDDPRIRPDILGVHRELGGIA
jgi:hypothetical protein